MSKTNNSSEVLTTDPRKRTRQSVPHPKESPAPMDQVFLSYSRDDRKYVSELARWLIGHGVKIWFDHDIDYGARWEKEIQEKLDLSTVLVVIMSKSAQKSKWVEIEVDRAKQRQILILPLLLQADGMVDCITDLQFENVVGGQMPGLRFCQKLPDFLISDKEIANALSPEQRDIAQRIFSGALGLRRGSKGHSVAALQVELLRVGLDPGPINGVFGEETERAVLEFQRRRCPVFTVDGVVGPLTWMILVNSSLGDLASPVATVATGRQPLNRRRNRVSTAQSGSDRKRRDKPA